MKSVFVMAAIAAVVICPTVGTCAADAPYSLRTCRMEEPADIVRPVFSWKMKSDRSGAAQSAYRLTVARAMPDGSERSVWDSGVVSNACSVGIRYAGEPLQSASPYVWRVAIRDERGVWSDSARARFETGFLDEGDWNGSSWITAADAKSAKHPDTLHVFRRVANRRRVVEAYLTLASLGAMEAYVNGAPVSRKLSNGTVRRDFLKPGYVRVDVRKHSFTYGITHLLKTEAGASNDIAADVSSGWWRDQVAGWTAGGGVYAKKSALRAVLVLRYDDGSEDDVGTGVGWLAAYGGPVREASIYGGESYDARVGWPDPANMKGAVTYDGFKGQISSREGPGVTLRADLAREPSEAYVWRGVDESSSNAYGRVHVVRRYAAGEKMMLAPGETLVVDFGQNASAVPEFKFAAAKGTALHVRFAETVNDGVGLKSRGNDGPGGSAYLKNLRSARARLEYVFAGGPAAYQPNFTFYGYRVVSLTASAPVEISRFRMIPVTSVAAEDELGSLETGVPAVNRLIANSRWGQLSNYVSIPTDCPQRDERQGWTGDTQVFAEAGMFNADTYAFLSKWMTDVRDSSANNGCFPIVAPCGPSANPRHGWSDAGVLVPWRLYLQFGDATVLEDNYESMSRYVDLVAKGRYRTEVVGDQFGDWLSHEKYERWTINHTAAGKELMKDQSYKKRATAYWDYIGACYWILDAVDMERSARALGRTVDAARYAKMAAEARAWTRETYLEKDGTLPPDFRDMQGPAVFALVAGLTEDQRTRADVEKVLRANLAARRNRLATGFLGTSFLLDAISRDMGDPTLAYSVLLQHECPGWLYSVDQGATTFWERWDGYRKDKGFGCADMNSFNHYAYGAVVAWMYRTMAGIRQDESAPGFRRFVLSPAFDSRLGHVMAKYDSANGRIESAWKAEEDGSFSWRFVVPANTTAVVIMPNGARETCVAGAYERRVTVKTR